MKTKERIGTINQKVLVRGDENFLRDNEILVSEDKEFTATLKKKSPNGGFETFIVMPSAAYIKALEDAHKQGYEEGKAAQTTE